MSDRAKSSQVPEIRLFEQALPDRLFERLVRAVRSLGREGLKRSYKTTFWFPLGADPTNVVEEAILELLRLVAPGPECIGMEWWLGRLSHGKELGFHFDRDLTLSKMTGQYVHPRQASVLYLNAFPSSPTVILDQVPGPDGKSRIPAKPKIRMAVEALPNHYLVFAGDLRHGVVPNSGGSERATTEESGRAESELRLSLLVNYWDRRPLSPMGMDFDGTIYACLRDEETEAKEMPRQHGVEPTADESRSPHG